MKKLVLIFFLGTLILNVALPSKAQAQIDPRLKALGSMAAYGAAGGLLLGTASLAFDAPGRAPFIGASLGLYAGILFGSYVVITHAIKKHRLENPGSGDEEYYPETPSSPYETPFSSGNPYGGENPQYRATRIHKRLINQQRYGPKKERVRKPTFYINLVNYSF